MAVSTGDRPETSPLEGLPARALTPDELARIEEAGGYELVVPALEVHGPLAPPGADHGALSLVVVASDWFAALGLASDGGGWHVVRRDGRHPEEPPELLYMVALGWLGLVDAEP